LVAIAVAVLPFKGDSGVAVTTHLEGFIENPWQQVQEGYREGARAQRTGKCLNEEECPFQSGAWLANDSRCASAAHVKPSN
jgi:hypothetical protein